MTRRAVLGAATLAVAVALTVTIAVAAGGKPTPRLNAYFPNGFDDTDYQKKALDKVLANWKVSGPLPAAGKKTVVISVISREGKLLSAYFNLETGNKEWDKAALDAVRNAAPFPPLPKSWKEAGIEVHWHFQT